MIDIVGLPALITAVRDIARAARDVVNIPQNQRQEAADQLRAALGEIDKSCVGLEEQLVRLLAVDLGNPREARSTLVALEGGAARAALAQVRGHCTRIDIIYQSKLDTIFKNLAPQLHQDIQQAFALLHGADSVMLRIIDQLSNFVADKAREILDFVDNEDHMQARVTLKDARHDVIQLRRTLSDLLYWLRDAEAGFNLATQTL